MSGERGRESRGGLLSGAYGRITQMRRAWYDRRPGRRRRLHHPVISVGNLASGGSGKTPVVASLARLLRDRGERPAILTRGYGRRETTEGVLVVSDGTRVLEPVSRSGDEPQLLARKVDGVPVLVSADRYIAGLFAERHFGVTVSILDDGFQHVQLERDIDLLLISPNDLQERVLPAGQLREPLDAARYADALLVAGTEEEVKEVASALGHPTAFQVTTRFADLKGPRRTEEGPRRTQEGRDGNRVLAFAGIARPERFFNALRSLGYDVARELMFRDHHWYTPSDLAAIQQAARDADASLIVTTEKDAVRCDLEVAVLPMSVEIEPAAEFIAWLMGRLH